MRKADIARSIHLQIGITEKHAVKVLDWILAVFKSTLQNGEEIAISGFGKFTVHNKRARHGRNPRTGEEILVTARRVVSFHASPLLRAEVNAAGQERQEPSQQINRADGSLVERKLEHGSIDR